MRALWKRAVALLLKAARESLKAFLQARLRLKPLSGQGGLCRFQPALKDMADKVVYIKSGKIEKIVENSAPKPIEEIEW